MYTSRLCTLALIGLLTACSNNSDSTETTNTNPIITVDNYESLLRELVVVANDNTLNAASDSLVPVFGTVAAVIDQAILNGTASGNGLTFVSSSAISEGGENAEYTFSCDSGGTLIARAYNDDSGDGPHVDQLTAENACSIDDASYEGFAFKLYRFVRGTDVSQFENFTVSQANGDSLLLDGDYSDSTPEGRGPRVETGWTNANLTVVQNGESTKVEDYTSNRISYVPFAQPGSGPFQATAKVNFTVTAPWSANEPIDVAVDLLYLAPEDAMPNDSGEYPAQWQSGTVRVTAADGTGFTLSPDTGDAATFSVVIDGDTGEPNIHNWADGFQITCATGYDCR